MGTTTDYNRQRGIAHKDYFVLGDQLELVESNTVGGFAGQWYAAVRVRETGLVFAMVIKFNWGRDGSFSYKEMTEDDGPFYYGASRKVLDALSPAESGYAVEWREKCLARIEARAEAKVRAKARKDRLARYAAYIESLGG